jgi:hypothetical protein
MTPSTSFQHILGCDLLKDVHGGTIGRLLTGAAAIVGLPAIAGGMFAGVWAMHEHTEAREFREEMERKKLELQILQAKKPQ